MSRTLILCVVATLIAACAAGSTRAAASTPVPRRDIQDLAIIPSTNSVCPGQTIQARYQAILGDGSRVELNKSELSRLALRGIAAEAAADGSWTTSANPLESAVSGFRLSVSLATDPGVHADTVIAPAYNCGRLAIGLPVSDRYNDTKARVRLGVFASPFYDSIAVAVIEPVGLSPIILIVDPGRMRPRSIQVSASGKTGSAGGAGNAGNDGGQCENGADGTDGDPGDAGQHGGQVDIIAQADAPWLTSLVAVMNPGGRGGAGGRGGRGGRAGARVPDQPGCNPSPGRSGRAGQPGQDGSPGPYPETTTAEKALLWRGSPIWFDSTARANLEQLMELPRRR